MIFLDKISSFLRRYQDDKRRWKLAWYLSVSAISQSIRNDEIMRWWFCCWSQLRSSFDHWFQVMTFQGNRKQPIRSATLRFFKTSLNWRTRIFWWLVMRNIVPDPFNFMWKYLLLFLTTYVHFNMSRIFAMTRRVLLLFRIFTQKLEPIFINRIHDQRNSVDLLRIFRNCA